MCFCDLHLHAELVREEAPGSCGVGRVWRSSAACVCRVRHAGRTATQGPYRSCLPGASQHQSSQPRASAPGLEGERVTTICVASLPSTCHSTRLWPRPTFAFVLSVSSGSICRIALPPSPFPIPPPYPYAPARNTLLLCSSSFPHASRLLRLRASRRKATRPATATLACC